MEKPNAIAALGALAHEGRLDVFRRLVLAGPDGMIHKLPLGAGWTSGRDMPAPAGRTFRELYARHKTQGDPPK